MEIHLRIKLSSSFSIPLCYKYIISMVPLLFSCTRFLFYQMSTQYRMSKCITKHRKKYSSSKHFHIFHHLNTPTKTHIHFSALVFLSTKCQRISECRNVSLNTEEKLLFFQTIPHLPHPKTPTKTHIH